MGRGARRFQQARSRQGQATHVLEQYGVTFSFAVAYPSGQFANGDWWVCPPSPGGTVTITSITPAYSAGQTTNGFQVNPSSMTSQGYDGRALPGWDAGLVAALPLTVAGGSSIVKAVSAADPGASSPDHLPSLQTAVVLTVLDAPPAQPSLTFRPPYYGVYKPLYTVDDLDASRLPSLAPVGSPPSLSWVRDRFQRVQLDQWYQHSGRYMHPADNFRATPGTGAIANYGANMAQDNNTAILRLMLSDVTWSQKQPALVNVLQAGIDWFGIVHSGGGWVANGGHAVGRKQMVFFAGMMFDSSEMKAVLAEPSMNVFCENDFIAWSRLANRPLWGYMESDPSDYWRAITNGTGRRDLADPTGQIDGGYNPGQGYQSISSNTFAEAALIVRLMNGESVWAHDDFLDYVDRWVSFGAWTQPDADTASRPDFWAAHGTGNRTTYRNAFLRAMWSAYR